MILFEFNGTYKLATSHLDVYWDKRYLVIKMSKEDLKWFADGNDVTTVRETNKLFEETYVRDHEKSIIVYNDRVEIPLNPTS